jgi:DNA-binding CsgD family transcriptional regulator
MENGLSSKNKKFAALFVMTYTVYQDVGNFNDIAEYASTLPSVEALRKPIIEVISQIVPAQGIIFLLSDSKCQGIDESNAIGTGFNSDIQEDVYQYRLLNPFHTYMNPNKHVVAIDDILPYSEWERHPFYELFCRPRKLHHKMVLYLRKDSRIYGASCLLRDKQHSNFSRQDRQICSAMIPVITSVISNVRLLSELCPYTTMPSQVNTVSSANGILLLDRNLDIIRYNAKAKKYCHLLSHKQPRRGYRNNGPLQTPEEILQYCIVLKELIKKGRQLFPITLQKYTFIDLIGWVRIECQLIWLSVGYAAEPYILVSLSNLLEKYNTLWETLRTKYQLTEREKGIIECVSDGLSNNEISQKLFISLDTVETHLKHIFRKTGVKNRTSLATLITA